MNEEFLVRVVRNARRIGPPRTVAPQSRSAESGIAYTQ
jgi:hypothetical protein